MNAGIPGKDISQILESVTVMGPSGRIKDLPRKQIKFAYRSFGLSRYIILSACLSLKKSGPKEIRSRIEAIMRRRRRAQDYTHPSCGCVFRNPGGESAGRLIDLCGLKGKRIGGAGFSRRHANFILNLGQASASDILRLMNLAKREVKRKFNLTLKPEVKIWK